MSEQQVTGEPVSRTFMVADPNLGRFRARMAQLAKRAAKIGVAAPTFSLGEPVDLPERQMPDGRETGVLLRHWPTTVSGVAPRYAGWTFLATLQHLGGEDDAEPTNIVRSLGGEVPDRYRNTGPVCEHCRIRRMRRDTYLVAHEDGRVAQVGSSCLRDFLGHQSPEHLAAMAELLAEVLDGEGWDQADWGIAVDSCRFLMERFIACTVAAIREFGWVSKRSDSDGTPTAIVVQDALRSPRGSRASVASKITDEDVAYAQKIIAWAATLEPRTDYEHNLRAVAIRFVVPDRTHGLAASMVPSYERAVSKDIERQRQSVSQHFGQRGERGIYQLTLERVIAVESPYGIFRVHIFHDDQGNIAVWKTNGPPFREQGKTYTVKATIKDHEVRRGVAQTVLLRLVEHKPKAPRSRRQKVAP